jgi:signal transduction histidine kinase
MDDPIDILVVDDESRNLDALEAVLSDPAYRLVRASHGDQALSLLLKHDVAAIVLDVQMPGLNGFELAHLIKGTRRFREIPIVFLTAHLIDDTDIVAGYGAGAVDYLTKPVNTEILRHKIAVFADLFRKTRALAELNETLEERVRQRTAELEKSEAALRASARQKDEFLATLAHELRNPLAPIRMGLDLLLRAEPRLDKFGRTLSVMNRQLEHMVRLIDDLLDVARISGGIIELKKERVGLSAIIQTAIETCRPFFEQRRQVISVDAHQGLFSFADATRLAQIVGNLLHNASKFTPEGGAIKLELVHENGRARLSVIDSGVGLSPAQLPRVFDMFARVEQELPDSKTGLGIGLALAQRLARMHDGELTVTSAGLGHGAVFTLALPCEVGMAQSATLSERPPLLASADLDILIIEDNVDVAELLSAWLDGRGYTTHVAHNGAAALELLERTQSQIVLCDLGLPEMDGFEICRRVKELPLASPPVMVALTGWGMAEDRRRTHESGFDHHLVKPVAPEALFLLLDSLGASLAATKDFGKL